MTISINEEGLWFYYQIGRAITSWAHVEQALCWVGCCSFTKDNQMQFITAFFSIENFRSKLQVVDRLVIRDFKQYTDQWKELKTNIERLSKIRNNLAHYTVMNYGNDIPGQRIALLPRFGEPSKFRKIPRPPPGSLTLRDIVHAERRFTAMKFGLEAFMHTLRGEKSIFPADAAKPPNTPTLAYIARQMRMITKLKL